MKAVLISVRPEWCEKIAHGEKTIEVRKTRPKLPTPFKCYIYCTRGEYLWLAQSGNVMTDKAYNRILDDLPVLLNGKVIGEFVCDEIYDWHCGYDSRYDTNCLVAMTCLDAGELYAYGQGKPLYGWHISDLCIYDTPKKLEEFLKPCPYGDVSCFLCDKSGYAPDMKIDCFNNVTRPPQSWCYAEELT